MVEYLNTLSVKTLREIAARMNVKGRSTMDKVTLIGAIGTFINIDHDEALEMNESLTTFTLPDTDIVLTGKSARVMRHHMASVKRFNPTLKKDKDGMVILSAKQRRRVQKNTRRYAKGIGFYAIP